MTTPPATCPACGASQLKIGDGSEVVFVLYECGIAYSRYYETTDQHEWTVYGASECRNAFDTAVRLRQENERLNKQLMELSVEYGKLKSQFGSMDTQPEETKD